MRKIKFLESKGLLEGEFLIKDWHGNPLMKIWGANELIAVQVAASPQLARYGNKVIERSIQR